MKKITLGFLLVGVMTILAIGYWALGIFSEGVTAGTFSKIQDSKPPLTTDEVVNLLGQPSHIDESESTGVKGEVYYYPWHKSEMKIVFVNGTVFHAEYTPDKKS